MYNVLICDDEQIMIDSLEFIIKKNFEGQINLFSALSGTDALAVVSREKIDIIFMDINMPGMSGLETIGCIMNLKPQTVIIVLSAFDKFQYAQEAMNLGAYKYITKPVNRNVVIQTVRNAMNLVDEKTGRIYRDGDFELQKKLDIVSPMVENDFIYSCIFCSDKNEDLSGYFDYFNMSVKDYFFVCIELPRIVDQKNHYEVCVRIRKILSDKIKCLAGFFMMNRIAIFIPVENNSEDLQKKFHTVARDVYTILTVELGQGLRAGISRLSSDLKSVPDCCKDALQALNRTSDSGEILFADDAAESSSGRDEKTAGISEHIFNRIKLGDSAGIQFLSDLYINELYSSVMEADRIKNNVFELLINARNIAHSVNPSWENSAFDNIFSSLRDAGDKTEVREFLKNRLSECAAAVSACREQKENPVIKKVCDYISEHMSENFSLENMAAVAGVSSFYLSKLFKEETGETFINYVTDKRIERARQMLVETNLSIKEITGQVGYNDQNYFSRLFKNRFGISPTDFRNSN